MRTAGQNNFDLPAIFTTLNEKLPLKQKPLSARLR